MRPGKQAEQRSKKMRENIWSSEGRIGLKAFWIRWLLYTAIIFIFGSIALGLTYVLILAGGLSYIAPWIGVGALVLSALAVSCLVPIQAVKRLHDVDKSGWFLLIPVYNLILLLTPGTEGPNRFGPEDGRAGMRERGRE
jgi:uncharacterized membrane protein YhaH (DUF805 family)